ARSGRIGHHFETEPFRGPAGPPTPDRSNTPCRAEIFQDTIAAADEIRDEHEPPDRVFADQARSRMVVEAPVARLADLRDQLGDDTFAADRRFPRQFWANRNGAHTICALWRLL